MTKVAAIIGPASSAPLDAPLASLLCTQANIVPTFFAVEDMVWRYPGQVDIAVVSPLMMSNFLARRAAAGFSAPSSTWSTKKADGVQYLTDDWNGGAELLAVKIAIFELGFDKVLLCGCSIDPDILHVERDRKFQPTMMYQQKWLSHKDQLAQFVRSFSGWTSVVFGKPDIEFILG